MKLRSLVTICAAMVLAAVSISAIAATTPYYALATSSSQVYMLGANAGWSVASQQITYGGQTATGLTGIAVKDNYAFVADSATDMLYVLEMKNFNNTPSFTVKNAVSLSNGTNSVSDASSVAVDASGNVYVIDSNKQIDGQAQYSTYAYIDKNLINPNAGVTASITRINNAALDGIAITPSGAIIAHTNTVTGIPGETYVTGVLGENTSNAMTPLNGTAGGSAENYYPVGVAMSGDIAYIANGLGTAVLGEEYGSLALFNTATWSKSGSTTKLLNDLIPSAITTFTRKTTNGTTNYLALIGTGKFGPMSNIQEALVYTLDASGNLGAVDEALLNAVDYSQIHKCSVSADGEVFWFVNQQAGTVRAWSTANWGTNAGEFASTSDGLGNIVAFDYTPVPEPAGLVALMSFSVGLIGFIKRKRLD